MNGNTLMLRCFAKGEASKHQPHRTLCRPFEASLREAPQGEDN